MARKTVAVAVNSFTAAGVEHPSGSVITDDHMDKWPDEALANRLRMGDIKYMSAAEHRELMNVRRSDAEQVTEEPEEDLRYRRVQPRPRLITDEDLDGPVAQPGGAHLDPNQREEEEPGEEEEFELDPESEEEGQEGQEELTGDEELDPVPEAELAPMPYEDAMAMWARATTAADVVTYAKTVLNLELDPTRSTLRKMKQAVDARLEEVYAEDLAK